MEYHLLTLCIYSFVCIASSCGQIVFFFCRNIFFQRLYSCLIFFPLLIYTTCRNQYFGCFKNSCVQVVRNMSTDGGQLLINRSIFPNSLLKNWVDRMKVNFGFFSSLLPFGTIFFLMQKILREGDSMHKMKRFSNITYQKKFRFILC